MITFPQPNPTSRAVSIAESESAEFPLFKYLRNSHSLSKKLWPKEEFLIILALETLDREGRAITSCSLKFYFQTQLLWKGLSKNSSYKTRADPRKNSRCTCLNHGTPGTVFDSSTIWTSTNVQTTFTKMGSAEGEKITFVLTVQNGSQSCIRFIHSSIRRQPRKCFLTANGKLCLQRQAGEGNRRNYCGSSKNKTLVLKN